MDRTGGSPGIMAAAAGLVAFVLLRTVLGPFGLPGVAAAQWVGLLAVPLLLLRHLHVAPAEALGAARPDFGDLLRGVLVGAGAFPLSWAALVGAAALVPLGPQAGEGLESAIRDAAGIAGVGSLFLVAVVTPAVCEEALFRGVFLRELGRRWPGAPAVGASALAFAFLHWTPGAGARMAPVLVLGTLLGWVAWRTASLWAAVAGHFVYNSLVVVSTRAAGPPTGAPEFPSALFLAAGVALVVVGIHLPIPSPKSRSP